MTDKPVIIRETLAERIARAAIDCGGFEADKENREQGYAYISADLVLERGGAALAKVGVAVVPSITETEIKEVSRPNKGPRLDARVVFSIRVSDGATEMVCPWVGFGSDYSVPDKAIYKAITSGHKYFLMKLLNIGVGNEDGEHETEPRTGEPKAAERMPPVDGTQKAQTAATTPAAQPAGQPADKAAPASKPEPPSSKLWSRYYTLVKKAKAAGLAPAEVPNTVSADELTAIGGKLKAALDARELENAKMNGQTEAG